MRLLIGLIALEALYLVNAGIFLNVPWGLRKLLHSDTTVQGEFKWAWSWYPGQIRLRALTLRIQDPQMQIAFSLERASLRVDLWALTQRTFRASDVRLEGLDFRFRLRRADKTEPSVAEALPPLPAFAQLPAQGESQRPPWKVALHDLQIARIERLWIDRVRFEGNAHLEGGLLLEVGGRALQIAPSRIHIADGSLQTGDKTIVEHLSADVEGELARIAPRDLKELEIFRALNVDVKTQAEIGSLEFLNYHVRGLKNFAFADGDGSLSAHLKVREGRLQPGSHLDIAATDLRMRLWRASLSGKGHVRFEFAGREPSLRAAISEYALHFGADQPPSVLGHDLDLEFRSKELDFASLESPVRATLQMPEARMVRLSALNPLLPKASSIRFLSGEAVLSAKVSAASSPRKKDHGIVQLKGRRIAVAVRNQKARGDFDLRLPLSKSQLDDLYFDISGSKLSLRRFYFEDEEAWWMHVDWKRARWDLSRGVRLQAQVALQARDFRPILKLYLLSEKTRLPDFVVDWLSFSSLKAQAKIAVDDRQLRLTDLRATSDASQLWGWLEERPGKREGRLLWKVGPFAAGLEIGKRAASLKLNDAFGWYPMVPPPQDAF